MALPTKGYVWLEDANFGGSRYAKVARSRTQHTMTVVDTQYDTGDYLSKITNYVRGDSPLVARIIFSGSEGNEWLVYHPGARTLQRAKEAFGYLNFAISMGVIIGKGAQSRAGAKVQGAEWKVPDELLVAAARTGQTNAKNLVDGAFDVSDLRRYPHEGYYYWLTQQTPELLVAGKIRANDIKPN
jgi:hypothetical protein